MSWPAFFWNDENPTDLVLFLDVCLLFLPGGFEWAQCQRVGNICCWNEKHDSLTKWALVQIQKNDWDTPWTPVSKVNCALGFTKLSRKLFMAINPKLEKQVTKIDTQPPEFHHVSCFYVDRPTILPISLHKLRRRRAKREGWASGLGVKGLKGYIRASQGVKL